MTPDETNQNELLRVGDWMCTFHGHKVYPLDPRPEEVCMIDIAHSLSMQCRYSGMTSKFYSVAEHCLLMALTARQVGYTPQIQLAMLVHDAAEAYLSDVIRPIKHSMPEYKAHETAMYAAIHERFAWPWPVDSWMNTTPIHAYDNYILYDEVSQLLAPTPEDWHMRYAPGLGVTILNLAPKYAKELYLAAYLGLSASVTGESHMDLNKGRCVIGESLAEPGKKWHDTLSGLQNYLFWGQK